MGITENQREQARSRQSPSQQGWRNQRQARKHPDPHVRKVYGQSFAAGYPETEKLSEVLLNLNETSLSQLRRDHRTAHLEQDRQRIQVSRPSPPVVRNHTKNPPA